jgi:hypothetical protein
VAQLNRRKECRSHFNQAVSQSENLAWQRTVTLPEKNHAELKDLLHSLLGPDIENSNLCLRGNSIHLPNSSAMGPRKIRAIQVLSDVEDYERLEEPAES